MTPARIAFTRPVSEAIDRCELTHRRREPIDLERARAQHREYEACLAGLDCRVIPLPTEPNLPDSVFIEDTAVVLPEAAVIARPGAKSRRPETAAVAEALRPFRSLFFLESPATLDGGDVLCAGKTIYIGRSSRSNPAGIAQMQALLEPLGYAVRGVDIRDCLHLKSAVTAVEDRMLLINPGWVDPEEFHGMRLVRVDPSEPAAANALAVGGSVVFPANFPATRARLESLGLRIKAVDMSELQKAEGAVTCCSLVFDA